MLAWHKPTLSLINKVQQATAKQLHLRPKTDASTSDYSDSCTAARCSLVGKNNLKNHQLSIQEIPRHNNSGGDWMGLRTEQGEQTLFLKSVSHPSTQINSYYTEGAVRTQPLFRVVRFSLLHVLNVLIFLYLLLHALKMEHLLRSRGDIQ